VPIRSHPLEVKRGEFALHLVVESEVQLNGFSGFAMVKRRACLARVMITVVTEENNFTADLGLKSAGGLNLGDKVTSRKEAARLLAKTDYGSGTHAL
jgi:hypothetical protein